MSYAATIWAWHVIRVQDVHRELTAPDKAVLLALSDRHNKKTGRCDPSHAVIAADTSLSRRSVMRSVRRLTDMGVIKTKQRTKDGRKDTLFFTLFGTMLARPFAGGMATESHHQGDTQSPPLVTDGHINLGSKPGTREKQASRSATGSLCEPMQEMPDVPASGECRVAGDEGQARSRPFRAKPARGDWLGPPRTFAVKRAGVIVMHGARIEEWRIDYNQNRPRSALGGLTPADFADQLKLARKVA